MWNVKFEFFAICDKFMGMIDEFDCRQLLIVIIHN